MRIHSLPYQPCAKALLVKTAKQIFAERYAFAKADRLAGLQGGRLAGRKPGRWGFGQEGRHTSRQCGRLVGWTAGSQAARR